MTNLPGARASAAARNSFRGKLAVCASTALVVSGCAVGPNYVRPTVEVPAAFKEQNAASRATAYQVPAPGAGSVSAPDVPIAEAAVASPVPRTGGSPTERAASPYASPSSAATAATPTAPEYSQPAPPRSMAASGREWRPAQPNDSADRGKWWEVFNDPQLNTLVEQVDVTSQTIAQFEAQVRAARAQVDSARAAEWPDLSLSASVKRAGRGVTTSSSIDNSVASVSSRTSTTRSVLLGTSWEIDLWGRVRREVESRNALADLSVAQLASARLSAQANVVNNYYNLRLVDAQKELYRATLAAYQKSIDLTTNRYKTGVVARADVVQAETQFKTVQVQAIDLDVQRAQLEHAIALSIGKPASEFSIPPSPLDLTGPELPRVPSAGLPSDLLERRPDIATAERRVASANSEIGVAKAAYFPSLSLSGSGGYSGTALSHLFSAPNRVWSIGPDLAQTLFDGGARRAATRQAEANYDANVAAYRQTVLTGFREVEDYLAQLRIYEAAAGAQADALESARRSLSLVTNQYKAGIVSYLNVIAAQTTALQNERSVADILGNRITATVLLIKALGGGWTSAALENERAK